ncbi:MAG: LLM class flavin-dependent oxidoreductase [Desulfurellaceae bacterium]|nr:LLM class flavin-dependent oxidoreductase [Desulfurellaceae bacterium]
MNKRIYFNAFHMNCVVHQSPGLWVREDDNMVNYTDLNQWVELAQLLERGRFDALFLADVVGVYDVFRGNREAAVSEAAQIPVNDPMLLIPAMAHATQHLGFGFTSSILQYPPFTFARLVSTLDHLTKGRVAWNIVTSYLESAARNYGQTGLPDHDERYAIADEYCDVCYKLWETSWEDGAVVKDRARGIYADPAKVHDVSHDGRYYQVHGCHLSEPSPQRTPVLFQAGASPRGREFAARHAECVFVLGSKPEVDGQYIRDIRRIARQQGRNPEDILCFAYLKVITGDTEAAAKRKYEEYFEQCRYDGGLALLSGWSGIDFGQFEPDQPLEYIETNAIRTLVHSFTEGDPSRKWTMRDLARYVGIGGAGPVLVGTPEHIADQLEDWIAAGVDGFNLAYTTTPGSFAEFIDGVVPVLHQRGRMQKDYAPGTLREKLYGSGRVRLPEPHPAARHRCLGTAADTVDRPARA